MSHRSHWRHLSLAALAAVLLALLPDAALAQAVGRIVGTVSADGGGPLAEAQVSVVGTRLGAATRADGRFVLANVPSGARQLRVLRLGYAPRIVDVEVPAGGDVTTDVTMTATATQLGGVVVSASRRVEKIIDAPATVSRIDAAQIENSAGNSFSGALKNVKGIDYVQTGMTTATINARGFNSSFNNRMLMIEDGRIAVLPENGLPVGTMTAIPKVDLAGIEVLVGPGAALYGADASNGVLTLQTKDPRQYPGTTVEVAGGNRNYRDVQMRHAGVTGRWGYKVTGEYQAADDWDNRIAVDGPVTPDFNSSVARGTGSLVYYQGDGRLEASAGVSQTDAIGQTNVGRNQLIDWVYNFQQLKYVSPRFYANAYRTQSLSGESYAINRFASYRPLYPETSVSADSLRRLSDWPADGRMYAAEAQANHDVAALLGTRVVFGGQWRNDVVSSKREWLTDRITGEDLNIQQAGAYLQTETPLHPMLNLVLAGRYDKHENYDAQFSPKAGLVVKPSEDQAFRVTYNRAFKSPTTLQTNFNIVDFLPGVGVFGNRDGFVIRNAAGDSLGAVSPIVPEENTTWELGYKGVLWSRLFVDVAGYRSEYDNFLTPLIVIAAPAAGTFAHMGNAAEPLRNPAGRNQTVLTYRNLGRAEVNGVDAGLRFLLTDRLALSGTASVIKADTIEIPAAPWLSAASRRELSVLNAPTTKWTAGIDGTDIVPGLLGGLTVRHVNEYAFASGVNLGVIPSFSTVDLNLGYRLPFAAQTQLNLQVTNLFSCRNTVTTQPAVPASGSTPATPANPLQVIGREGKCGFGEKHTEMINMPEVGTMVFLGVRYQR